MNCLLLLMILCCCGQGNSSHQCGSRPGCRPIAKDPCCHGNCMNSNRTFCRCQTALEREGNLDAGRERERENSCGCGMEPKKETKCGCEEETGHHKGNLCSPPPAARTQYPYIDLEPRTCGCEEKK